jgi:Zinc finger, C2H2 type
MDKKFFCDKCNYSTDIKASYEKHLTTILHKTGDKGKRKSTINYKCEICDYTTKNNNNFMLHKLNNHAGKEERKEKFKYYCEECDFGSFAECNYKNHLKSKGHLRHKL